MKIVMYLSVNVDIVSLRVTKMLRVTKTLRVTENTVTHNGEHRNA